MKQNIKKSIIFLSLTSALFISDSFAQEAKIQVWGPNHPEMRCASDAPSKVDGCENSTDFHAFDITISSGAPNQVGFDFTSQNDGSDIALITASLNPDGTIKFNCAPQAHQYQCVQESTSGDNNYIVSIVKH